MEKFTVWLEHKEPLDLSKPMPKGKPTLNKLGGVDPTTAKQKKVFKHADVITLPQAVKGTNCFNCEYVETVEKGLGFCRHHEIQQYVTAKNCCKYWDHPDAHRNWKQD